MAYTILVKRGQDASIPALHHGELYWAHDTNTLYIGDPGGNESIGGQGDYLLLDASNDPLTGQLNIEPVHNDTSEVYGLKLVAYNNNTGAVNGFDGIAYLNGANNIITVRGGTFQAGISSAGSGDLTSAIGLQTKIVDFGSGSITNGTGILINAISAPTGSSIGLDINDITGGFTAIAIRTDAGLVILNNNGDADSDVRIEGGTNTHLLFTDAGNDAVGINVSAITGKLHVDQSSTTGAKPVLTVDQADVSEEFIRFIGTSANTVLTQSIVEDADVTTSTLQGWLKVYVQDDGDQLTDQAYFIPIYTLS